MKTPTYPKNLIVLINANELYQSLQALKFILQWAHSASEKRRSMILCFGH